MYIVLYYEFTIFMKINFIEYKNKFGQLFDEYWDYIIQQNILKMMNIFNGSRHDCVVQEIHLQVVPVFLHLHKEAFFRGCRGEQGCNRLFVLDLKALYWFDHL